MIGLDKIKAFFKWYGERMGVLQPKPEPKGTEKRGAKPPETKVAEAPEKKANESSSR